MQTVRHFFVLNRVLMGYDEPDLDKRVQRLRKCLKDKKITRLSNSFQTTRLRVKYYEQETVLFDELYLTKDQFDRLRELIKS
jgi:hypothetical protein